MKMCGLRVVQWAAILAGAALITQPTAAFVYPPPQAGQGDHRAAMGEGAVELRHKPRASAHIRAHKSRVARLKARYVRMAKLRARVPAKLRVARARRELQRQQSRGTLHCLATAIYHEARYESVSGQRAVAEVVMARAKTPGRPKSICGVVYEGAWRATGCQFSFTCDGLSDGARDPKYWNRAKTVAATALRANKRVARGATFYHASYVKPRWAKRMVRVAKIGAHIFYRPRKGRLS
jgi:spore germination cell wall hydrolase CwlJ-like protein